MSKTYLLYEPDQQLLLPAALQEWLPDDHLAYFISDVVDQLDISEVTARYERERRGGPPYHPRMMVEVLLYGYCVGVAPSRRIAQRLHEDIAFRVLAANNTPDFRTISDFRKDDLDALSGLFVQVLALCRQAGLVKLGHAALEAEAQAAAEQAEAEGRKHPWVPDDKAQRNFTDTESRIIPAPGGKDFLQAYNCQAVVDSAHQVIVAARATNQTSDKQQAAAMMEETIDNVGAVPGKYPPMLAITRRRQSTSSMLWAWTRSSRHCRPATAGLCHPRPEVAYPAICLPGTGCDGSYRPGGVGSATLCGCKLWSRYSARSSRAGDSGSSCCGDWRR